MKYKSTFIYVDNLDYLKHNDNFEENDVSINNVNYYIFQTSKKIDFSKKNSLDPIKKRSNN